MNQLNQKDFITELNQIGKIFNHQFSRTKGVMRYSSDHEYSIFKKVRGELRLVDYYLKCTNEVPADNYYEFIIDSNKEAKFTITNFKEYSFSSIQGLVKHLWGSSIKSYSENFARNILKEEREKLYSTDKTFNLSLPNNISINNIPKEMLFPKNHHLPDNYWTELSVFFYFLVIFRWINLKK